MLPGDGGKVVTLSTKRAWACLEEVKDPEIPVVSVVDMGIVRDISQQDSEWVVQITPTYSGCPAMQVIATDIAKALKQDGFTQVRIETILSPAWTTDWMSDKGRQNLKEYGIAPPKKTCASTRSPFKQPDMTQPCPFCDSASTELRSMFGSTACKALYYCNGCHQPFESFKCI